MVFLWSVIDAMQVYVLVPLNATRITHCEAKRELDEFLSHSIGVLL